MTSKRLPLVILVPALVAGCSGVGTTAGGTEPPEETAVRYIETLDAGDVAQCDLSVQGVKDRAACERSTTGAPHALAKAPRAVATYEWTSNEGVQGKAVAVEMVLKANPSRPQAQAVGLVQQDGRWLVVAHEWTDSAATDQISTVGALS